MQSHEQNVLVREGWQQNQSQLYLNGWKDVCIICDQWCEDITCLLFVWGGFVLSTAVKSPLNHQLGNILRFSNRLKQVQVIMICFVHNLPLNGVGWLLSLLGLNNFTQWEITGLIFWCYIYIYIHVFPYHCPGTIIPPKKRDPLWFLFWGEGTTFDLHHPKAFNLNSVCLTPRRPRRQRRQKWRRWRRKRARGRCSKIAWKT